MLDLKLDELSFDEKSHIYFLNGVQIPSVTQIIKPVSDSTYGAVSPLVLERASVRGTAVHKAIENYLKYGIVTVPDEFSGYTAAFLAWMDKRNPDVEASELRFYHKLMRYAGTVDLIAVINGKRTLVDFKTSSTVIEKTHRLQLEGYTMGLKSFGIEIEDKLNLYLKNDGTYNEVFYDAVDREAWVVFGGCKSLYDYIHK
ncbi:MAG: hypothetical protein IJM76_05695 [Lachnospiraceae bacterium]|nr:hypothetical protein [Lachnospiraceae bacterium]